MAEEGFTRQRTGPFTLRLLKQVLEQVHDHDAILTLTVSTGQDERVFYFTRGALLFLAIGKSGGEVLARKIRERGLVPDEKLAELCAQANSSAALLQDLLKNEAILEDDVLKALVEETLEDHLLEVSLWEGAQALADVMPGNPPPRIYDHGNPSVRLSLGMKALLGRVRPKVDEASLKLVSRLGGSFRNRVKKAGDVFGLAGDEARVLELATDPPRSVGDLLVEAQASGLPAFRAAQTLVGLVEKEIVSVERVAAEKAREEELKAASNIEDALEAFINKLLARTHLAAIYERIEDKERAAAQHQLIAREHLARGGVDEAVGSLKQASKLVPTDIAIRELLVKVLQGAGKTAEAAFEAVDLGRTLLKVGLPGRACQAFEFALRLAPSLGLMRMLAGLLARIGRKEDAVARYEQIAELAKKQGDEASYVDAMQRIFEIDPSRKDCAAVLRGVTGYRRAVIQRVLVATVPALLALVLVVYGFYETLALSAFDDAKKRVFERVDEEKFDVARSIVADFQRAWTLSRTTSGAATDLRLEIDREEQAARAQQCARAVREARKLEAAGKVPDALARWRFAQGSEDRSLRETADAAVARCDARVKKALAATEEAKRLSEQSQWQEAWQGLTVALGEAPWLLGSPDVKVPCRIESDPPGARVFVDGLPEERKTPLVLERPPSPWKLGLQGNNRETVTRSVAAVPPWPIHVLLPRRPSWRRAELVPHAPPFVSPAAVFVCGADRSVAALSREDGEVEWRVSLGVFGESELSPAVLEGGAVVVRTSAGTVSARDGKTGKELWTREIEPPPQDTLDSQAARPLAVAGGVVVREGARSLVLLEAADGKPRFWVKVSSDVLGAPAVSPDHIFLVHERTLEARRASDGTPAWTVRLDLQAATGPAVGPHGVVHVGLEAGGVARVDAAGKVLSTAKGVVASGITTPLDGDASRVVVGGASGEVVSIDADGQAGFVANVNAGEPVLWTRSGGSDLVLAGDARTLCAIDRRGVEIWRHPVEDGTPAVADELRIYQGSKDGVSAFDR